MSNLAKKLTRKTKKRAKSSGFDLKLLVTRTHELAANVNFLLPKNAAWAEAWKGLFDLAGCVVATNPNNGERWKYILTYNGFHEFRHKSHPGVDGQRLYARVHVDGLKQEGSLWVGSPYPDDTQIQIELGNYCPLRVLFQQEEGGG